ncbi:MAG: hypothetical protein ACSHX0_12130 [Akkermansiaceae bacterium]
MNRFIQSSHSVFYALKAAGHRATDMIMRRNKQRDQITHWQQLELPLSRVQIKRWSR